MLKGLIVTPRLPFPPIGGDKLRIFQLCRILAERHSLTLLSLTGSYGDMDGADPGFFDDIIRVPLDRSRAAMRILAALPTRVPLQVAYYRNPSMRRKIGALAGGHDYVLCHLLRTAVLAEDAPVPRVVELSDSLSLQYERILDVPYVSRKHRILYSIERRRVARLEQQIIESFDLVSMVSHRDAMYQRANGSNKIRVFPLGIDVKSFHYHERIDRSDRILFLGNMRTAVNQVACLFFANEVLPIVRKRQPNLKLAVAGLTPKGVARKLVRYEGIELIGPFGDANDVLSNGFCGVAPMVGASGVQSKILEYMASGLPTVASREALSSMTLGRAEPDEIALTGDTASQLADAVLSLWSDATLRTSLAQKARRYVEEHHDWSVCLQPLAREIEDLVERSRAPRVDLQQTRP